MFPYGDMVIFKKNIIFIKKFFFIFYLIDNKQNSSVRIKKFAVFERTAFKYNLKHNAPRNLSLNKYLIEISD